MLNFYVSSSQSKYMKVFLLLLALAMSPHIPALADGADCSRRAMAIVQSVTEQFPPEPVSLAGSLILRRQGGIVISEHPFSMELRWSDSPAKAFYRLDDAFGRNLGCFEISRMPGKGGASMRHFNAEGEELPPPDLSASIGNTDMTWLDISLSFLWWDRYEIRGSEKYKGAQCIVVDAFPPSPIGECERVRLWIDEKRGFLRQAEQIGPGGETIRKMWVSSIGKINGRWMIKNMEVQRPGTGTRTKMRIESLEEL